MNEANLTESSPKNEFSWHQSCWQQFIKARNQNHLPHAILLTGEEGIGKFSLARRMAKSLICINNISQADNACNNCQSCKTYESSANPDYTEITLLEDKQQIAVDQIRGLSQFLNYSRSFNTTRVVIISPVERMNLNAANSLLKSLEEPTAHTVLILVTSKASQLLPTIKSRCQSFTVSSPTTQQSLEWLRTKQNESASADFDNVNADKLLEITGNKPLKAIKLTQSDIDDRDQFFNDLSAIINRDRSLTEIAKKWEKHDVETVLNWQITKLQNAIKNKANAIENKVNQQSSINTLLQKSSEESQWQLYQNLLNQKQYIHTSVNSLMFMENMLMLWLKAD